jgi:ABC-type uncharacterized transport system permease subunit
MLDTREFSTVKGSSTRVFGLFFAAFFALITFWPLIHGLGIRFWALGLALAFLAASLLRPQLLEPLNRLWFLLGIVLGKIMTPVVMLLIYVLTIVPIGLILRMRGKDPMARRFDREAKTYWKPHPGAGSMKRQF